MKTTMKIVLGAAVLLVITGLVGGCFFNGRGMMNRDDSFGRGMMGDGDYNMPNNSFDIGGGTMHGERGTSNTGAKIDLEDLEHGVNSYIGEYEEELVNSDIFVFENSVYYFSIMEEDTGMGAMELLVNPYTGDIYPEFGPNMMWNLKYGMHGSGGRGMMGRGMMGGRAGNDSFSADDVERNAISIKDAQSAAAQYISGRADDTYTVSIEGHEFYGYYTFHLEQNGETVGMMSVNGFTGDVWYHDWHGTVEQVIDGHTDDH